MAAPFLALPSPVLLPIAAPAAPPTAAPASVPQAVRAEAATSAAKRIFTLVMISSPAWTSPKRIGKSSVPLADDLAAREAERRKGAGAQNTLQFEQTFTLTREQVG